MRWTGILLFFSLLLSLNAQVPPGSSPYAAAGTYSVVEDSIMNVNPDVLIFRPSSLTGAPYPTILFQPGANGFSTSYINKHSYDLYWNHVASYGYVVIILNNTTGGPNNTLFTTSHDWIKDSVNTSTHWMNQYVDLSRFYVAGHSNGGINATKLILDRPAEVKGIIYMASYPNPDIFGIGGDDVSTYSGQVMFLNGEEDNTSVPLAGTTNAVSLTSYGNFSSSDCKVRVMVENAGHGAFGDYGDPAQPVGSIGRVDATNVIRHYLISFFESRAKNSAFASQELSLSTLQPLYTLQFEESCSNDLDELPPLDEVNVFPNPFEDHFIIDYPIGMLDMSIMDISGKIISRTTVSGRMEIPASELPDGIYLVAFSDAQGNQMVRRLVKIR